jgi:hypothetical protein
MNMSDSEKPKTDPADANASGTCCAAPGMWLNDAEEFARREPVKAVACAFGAGLLLHLLPTRATTAVVSTLVRPVLLCLGLMKAFEICGCNKEPKV